MGSGRADEKYANNEQNAWFHKSECPSLIDGTKYIFTTINGIFNRFLELIYTNKN